MLRKQYLLGAAAALLAASGAQSAFAQTAQTPAQPPANPSATTSDADAGLGEIVVTARKTRENLQSATADITAVTGQQLQSMGANDLQALQRLVPSASMHTQGPVVQAFIRGVGSRVDSPNFAASSIILFNGIVMPRYGTGGIMFDLDSVQAIAGPQGTLYGGSAAGGAINVNSVAPAADFAGNGLVEYGDYNTQHVALAQNIAINDTNSVRASADFNHHDGYESFGVDGLNRFQSRLSYLTQPTDNLRALFFIDAFRDNGKPKTTFNTIPNRFPDDPWRLPAFGGPKNVPINSSFTSQNYEAFVAGWNVDWDLGGNHFTYIPGYVSDSTDQGPYYFGGSGNLLHVRNREHQHSEEIRWNRDVGPVKLTAGFLYLNDHSNTSQVQGVATFSVPPYWVNTFVNDLVETNTAYGLFGQAVISLNDNAHITLGARQSRNEIDAHGISSGKPFLFNNSEDHVDYKIGFDVHLAPSFMVYINAETGYIPFGYNPDTTTALPVTPAAIVPRSDLNAISGGFKSRFLDNKLQINIEAYNDRYENFQAIAFVQATALSTVLNAKESRIYGADVNIEAILPYETTFTTNIVVQSAHYTNFSGVGYNFSGNQMVNAPDTTVNATLEHVHSLGGWGQLTGEVDSHYESGHFGNFNNFPNARQPAYTKTNISLTYEPADANWRVQGFVNNITDAVEYGSPSPGATPAAVATTNLTAPRTVGLRFMANWP